MGDRVGITTDNVVFTSAVSGPYGKGVAAARLGLSHFVDDKSEVLESVMGDENGNSKNSVKKFDGILFHFDNGGRGRQTPKQPLAMSSDLKAHYCGVSGWAEALEHLRNGLTMRATREAASRADEWMSRRKSDADSKAHAGSKSPQHEAAPRKTTKAAASKLVHRISVGIEEDAAFGVVNRLIGAVNANFAYIASSSGAKVLLNGRGSPHPQPKSCEEETLTVCIRASSQESLEDAISSVEDLLEEVRRQHRKFKK